MHFFQKKLLIALTFILFCSWQSAFAVNPTKQGNNDSAIQNAILVQINQYRMQHGLSQLTMDNRMVIEARKHSIEMANHSIPFGHKYFASRIDRLHKQIKNSNAGAENVAYNYKDAHDVVKNWLLSPGHKRNIDGNYNLTGIGVARDQKGKLYFTQIFLRTGKHVRTVKPAFSSVFIRSFFKKIS